MSNTNNVVFKRTTLAALTALYFGATGHAFAEAGFKPVEGSGLYEPTFTSEDIARVKQERLEYLTSDLLAGHAGQINKVFKIRKPQDIFKPQEGVSGKQTYIVQMTEQPVASYKGDIQGYPATAAPKNSSLIARGRVAVNSEHVDHYKSLILGGQNRLINNTISAGANPKVKKQFSLASNAMVVEMTQEEAVIMSQQPGVKHITPNRIFELRTDRGPEFISADKVWSGEVTPDSLPVKGEGMVVGIIDTGINSDHPSFASDEEYTTARGENAGVFFGDCAPEVDVEKQVTCNDKLIGVRSYPEITTVYNASEFQQYSWQSKQIRPENGEDYNGHGSHTAGTVAGNVLTDIPLQTVNGEAVSDGVDLPFTFPKVSGVAPRAHIISYQVCWPGGGGDPYAGCPESAILSAFEDAITDGVDAINFSIGGQESFPWEDPMELAFLAAREAGISVAAAAGNSGPSFWSSDHSSPWVTTVGASTHDRVLEAGVKSMTNFADTSGGSNWRLPKDDIQGKSFTGALSGTIVLAENYPDPDVDDGYRVELCNAPFPADTFTADEIVMCKRGDIARVEKAENVAAGGAGGFILYNASWSETTVADNYVIPGIHIDSSSGNKIRNWLKYTSQYAPHTATITASENNYEFITEKGNNLAIFSSMGPSRTNNTLVPDLTAPGVDIYAPNADDQPFTNFPRASDWTMMSGTSMAAPHVTGAQTLLAQMHPDWTPAEIQSALMLTANEVKLEVAEGVYVPTFYNFMAGAGAIDVAKAAKTGLVMDETIEGYKAGNPNAGGNENWINIPSMVDLDCELTCTFMRTVTATQDGTWSANAIAKDMAVDAIVTPEQFTLAKGESQTLVIKLELPNVTEFKVEPEEPGYPWEAVSGNYSFYDAMLELTEVNDLAPKVHMPMVVANVIDELPLSKSFDIYAEIGSIPFRVNTDNYSEFTPRHYGLVKPTLTAETKAGVRPYMNDEYVNQATWGFQSITVPEGAKRLVVSSSVATPVEALDEQGQNPRYVKFFPTVVVGFDVNGNGHFIPTEEERQAAIDEYGYEGAAWGQQRDAEFVCMSTSESEENICSIIDPMPGTYWIASPLLVGSPNYTGLAFNSTTRYAVITDDVNNNNFAISGPASHDGNGDYNLELSWNLPGAKQGDIYYGGFDLGNMPGAEGTLGFTAVDLIHGGETVSWNVSKETAKSMDVVDVNVKVLANLEAYDRDVDLSVIMPEGMRLAPETIMVSNPNFQELVVADAGKFTLKGTQLTTRNVGRQYTMSTNLDSEMCHTPLIDEYSTGGYIDLFGEFRMQPNADWMVGDYKESFDVPIDWLFYKQGTEFKLYNQENSGYMRMHAVGANQFNTAYWSMRFHRGPGGGFLMESLAPFWRGSFEMKNRNHYEDPWGLTLASQYAEERPDLGDLVFMEFDNVTDKYTGEEFDFEMILRSGIDYNPGMFEVIYAYDNLAADVGSGAIHIEGFDSAYSSNAGPKDGFLWTHVGFDNLDEVLQDDLVICFDYQGPEQSELDISFKAVIQPEATGSDLTITFDHNISSQQAKSLTHNIHVNGNIKVADINDMTVAEDSRIDGIEVLHIDANQVANVLEVTGDNLTAEVDGMMFNLIPDANFTGETEVTVTVRDMEHSGDAASTTFILTVTPTNDDAVVSVVNAEININEGDSATLEAVTSDIDGDDLTITWTGVGTIATANDNTTQVTDIPVGSHEFMVTVTDGTSTVMATVTVNVNAVPVAAVLESSIFVNAGAEVMLDGTPSTDVDSDLTYSWTGAGSIASANSASTSVTDLAPGTHTFTLTVSDGSVESTSTVTVVVNGLPTANVVASEIAINEGEMVTLDASTSVDVEGDVTFSWTGDGSISDASAATTTVSNLAAGTYTFMVTVSDGFATSTAQVMVTVNALPTAIVAESSISLTEGETALLDASSSTDVDGELTFEWTGDAEITNPGFSVAEAKNLTPGSYAFTVTVSDGMAMDTATVNVTVNAASVDPEEEKGSSGGSFGWMLLFALPLLVRRKR